MDEDTSNIQKSAPAVTPFSINDILKNKTSVNVAEKTTEMQDTALDMSKANKDGKRQTS